MLLLEYGCHYLRRGFRRPRPDRNFQTGTSFNARRKNTSLDVDIDYRELNCELSFWLFLKEEELKGAILAVLANKQDMEGAMSVAEVHQALGLDLLRNRTFQIFKTSAVKGEGLDSAMDWLSNALQSHK